MWPNSFLLLQNEGALLQGCFKSSLLALRNGSSVQRGLFYVAFFNYAIGLERLIKVILLLDHWHRKRAFLTDTELRKFSHNLEMLYKSSEDLFGCYDVGRRTDFEADKIDRKLLGFLSEFAKSNRYFNLASLAEATTNIDPLTTWEELIREVYENDVSQIKRESNEDQVDAFIENTESRVVHVESTSLAGVPQMYREFCQDHEKFALAMPPMCWRMVKVLVPLFDLLIVIQNGIHEEDHRKGEDMSVPQMEEFLDFVCEDKEVVLKGKNWP